MRFFLEASLIKKEVVSSNPTLQSDPWICLIFKVKLPPGKPFENVNTRLRVRADLTQHQSKEGGTIEHRVGVLSSFLIQGLAVGGLHCTKAVLALLT